MPIALVQQFFNWWLHTLPSPLLTSDHIGYVPGTKEDKFSSPKFNIRSGNEAKIASIVTSEPWKVIASP